MCEVQYKQVRCAGQKHGGGGNRGRGNPRRGHGISGTRFRYSSWGRRQSPHRHPIKARQIKAIARVLGQFPQIVKQIF